ncbi:MAG: tRNA dihydrouridine(20/20a) synthase DusA, partial [Pseudomonadota bacterium]
GCPSDRVQSGTFGAVLMKSPELVAECVAAMHARVRVPVTVKCRIGVDEQIPEDVLPNFLAQIRKAGVTRVAVHARKAWLKGLSPKENREVPPLNYPLVYAMKAVFPDMHISLNGGVETLDQASAAIRRGVDGVMIGRAAYHTPWDILGDADRTLFGQANPCADAFEVVERMIPYIEHHLAEGGRLNSVTHHMLGLFAGRAGARIWRRMLSEGAYRDGAGIALLLAALEEVRERRAA